ncbi:MAG: thioredoxin family protein [Actinobacteria bacterium]|nr:thioredoxin family protein [Actinomycetota bacterium]
MERLLLAAALVAAAVAIALVLQRRRPDSPVRGGWTVPAQLDRRDFERPDAPWLVVVFTSASCDSCGGVLERAEALASDRVAVQNAEVGARRDLHDRYGIDAVPTLVVADGEGVVRASFVGPVNATDLWGTLAELREPGSLPPSCDHGKPASP